MCCFISQAILKLTGTTRPRAHSSRATGRRRRPGCEGGGGKGGGGEDGGVECGGGECGGGECGGGEGGSGKGGGGEVGGGEGGGGEVGVWESRTPTPYSWTMIWRTSKM